MDTYKNILLFTQKTYQELEKHGEIDFQQLTDFALKLTQARFVFLNLFVDGSQDFKTINMSGQTSILTKIVDYLNFNPIGKTWKFDPQREEKINKRTITVFKSASDLIGKKLPGKSVKYIEKMANIGELVIVRIVINKNTAADFTIFMDKNEKFFRFEETELFANQVCAFIEKMSISKNLLAKEEEYKFIVETTGVGTWDWDLISNKVTYSSEWKKMLNYSNEEIGNTVNEWKKLWHPEDKEKIEKAINEYKEGHSPYYEIVHRLKSKNGGWKWILTKGVLIKDDQGKNIRWSGINVDLTDIKELEKKFQVLVDNSYDIIYRINIKGEFEFVSQAWTKLLGHNTEDILGKSYQSYLHPEDIEKVTRLFQESSRNNKKQEISEYRIKHINGSWHTFNINSVAIYDDSGGILGYTGVARDISDLKEALDEALKQKELFRTTLFSVGDGVISTDSKGRILFMNKAAEEITGWPLEEANKKLISEVFYLIQEGGREKVNVDLGRIINNSKQTKLQNLLLVSRSGKEIPIEKKSSPIKDSDGNITGIVIVFSDNTERKAKEKEVEYLSYYDHLTGIYNRRYIENSLIGLDKEENLPISIMAMDINGLKMVNDAFGHEMGDDLLKSAAQILKEVIRSEDILGRIGGDEFIIILPKTDSEKAYKIKQRILAKIAKKTIDSVAVSLAIGFATKKEMYQDINDIQKQADVMMYKDKLISGRQMRFQTISNILENIDKRYLHEKEHREKVALFSLAIGQALNFDKNSLKEIKLAAAVHDVGKIKIPFEILNKKKELTKKEWQELKKHPVTGYNIIKDINEYAGIAEEVLYHHERYDGKGYPKGLKGDEIPLISRIINVADAFEAMTAGRPYKEKKSIKEALNELKINSGKQFSPEIVDTFIRIIEERGY